MSARRRRGLLLLAVALVCGALAAAEVRQRERALSERLGPEVEVLIAARDLPAGARLTRAALAVRRLPARFVPPDALPVGAAAPGAGALGARVAVPVPAGGYLTAGAFSSDRPRTGAGLGEGERALTVEALAGATVAELAPGALVDVLVSSESVAGAGRTEVALAGVELLALEPAGGAVPPGASAAGAPAPADAASAPVDARATLRVTLAQAVELTEADNFAREIRLLARPGGSGGG